MLINMKGDDILCYIRLGHRTNLSIVLRLSQTK